MNVEVISSPGRLIVRPYIDIELEKEHRTRLDLTKLPCDSNNIIIQFRDHNLRWQLESVGTAKEGQFYRITNLPRKVTGISMGDLVEVEEEYGRLFFCRVVEYGSHGTIQVAIVYWTAAANDLIRAAQMRNCAVRWTANRHISLCVSRPINDDAKYLLHLLDKGELEGCWRYRTFRPGELL